MFATFTVIFILNLFKIETFSHKNFSSKNISGFIFLMDEQETNVDICFLA